MMKQSILKKYMKDIQYNTDFPENKLKRYLKQGQTVGDLKKALADYPDDMPVHLEINSGNDLMFECSPLIVHTHEISPTGFEKVVLRGSTFDSFEAWVEEEKEYGYEEK